jgi:acetyl/propionyl-CoA carboxylase alpha subunit
MSADWEIEVEDEPARPAEGYRLEWVSRRDGLVRLSNARGSLLALVEGGGSEWWVVLRGRRLRVTVRSWRERMLAETRSAAEAHGGPVEVTATLPGLIAAGAVVEGSEVAEGDPLLTLEAMKMQNEVRSPRAGRVAQLAVSAGQAVAAGQLLLRIE